MFDKLLHPIHAARSGMEELLIGGVQEKEKMSFVVHIV